MPGVNDLDRPTLPSPQHLHNPRPRQRPEHRALEVVPPHHQPDADGDVQGEVVAPGAAHRHHLVRLAAGDGDEGVVDVDRRQAVAAQDVADLLVCAAAVAPEVLDELVGEFHLRLQAAVAEGADVDLHVVRLLPDDAPDLPLLAGLLQVAAEPLRQQDRLGAQQPDPDVVGNGPGVAGAFHPPVHACASRLNLWHPPRD